MEVCDFCFGICLIVDYFGLNVFFDDRIDYCGEISWIVIEG